MTDVENIEENWWDNDKTKKTEERDEVIEDFINNKTEKTKKKKPRKRKKIEDVDTNLMSGEDDVKTGILDLVGNVGKEELAEWVDKSQIRLVIHY